MKSLLPFLSWNYSALSPLHLLPTPLNLQTEHKIKTANNRIRSQRIFCWGENLPTFPVHSLRKLKKGYKSFTNWANCEAGWIVLLIVISSYSPWNWHFRLYVRHPKSNFTFQPLIFRGLKRVTLNLHPKDVVVFFTPKSQMDHRSFSLWKKLPIDSNDLGLFVDIPRFPGKAKTCRFWTCFMIQYERIKWRVFLCFLGFRQVSIQLFWSFHDLALRVTFQTAVFESPETKFLTFWETPTHPF